MENKDLITTKGMVTIILKNCIFAFICFFFWFFVNQVALFAGLISKNKGLVSEIVLLCIYFLPAVFVMTCKNWLRN
jgi:hypothetical protein